MELLFFLPAVLALGIVTSYTDIRHGLIRNRHVMAALAYAPLAYVALSLYVVSAGGYVRALYFFDVSLNIIIAIAFSFAAWNFGMWSAADGKLFIAYAALLPLTVYSGTYFAYFPSFVLLMNTFVPAFVFMSAKAVLSGGLGSKLGIARKLKLSNFAVMFLNVFWISWAAAPVKAYLNFDMGPLGVLALMMFVRKFMKRLAGFRGALAISALRVVLDFQTVSTAGFAVSLLLNMAVAIPMFILLTLNRERFSEGVRISSLKPGMEVTATIFMKKGKYVAVDDMGSLVGEAVKKSDMLKLNAGGLTRGDIMKLRRLQKAGKLAFGDLKVSQTFPSSPFLFAGALATIVSGGNLFTLFFSFMSLF